MAQREERAVPIPVPPGEIVLDGLYVAGESAGGASDRSGPGAGGGAVIAPPHPLYGGSMENPVVTELGFAFANAGQASLRFNWRGVGASGGAPSGELDDAVADYGAALEQLLETVEGPMTAAGYSFGAVSAVSAARDCPRVRDLVLVAPPPSMIDVSAFRADQRVLFLVGERDQIAAADALAELAASLAAARCVVIPDCDHFFGTGLGILGKETARWLDA